jgi:hypothetical protein
MAPGIDRRNTRNKIFLSSFYKVPTTETCKEVNGIGLTISRDFILCPGMGEIWLECELQTKAAAISIFR